MRRVRIGSCLLIGAGAIRGCTLGSLAAYSTARHHRLADPEVADARFRQRECDLAAAVGSQSEHRLPGRHHLPGFDLTAGDDAILGRTQLAVSGLIARQIELGTGGTGLAFGRAQRSGLLIQRGAADHYPHGLRCAHVGAGTASGQGRGEFATARRPQARSPGSSSASRSPLRTGRPVPDAHQLAATRNESAASAGAGSRGNTH